MQFKVYSRKYRDVMAAYGRYLAPYYDRAACYEYREAVINLETVGGLLGAVAEHRPACPDGR